MIGLVNAALLLLRPVDTTPGDVIRDADGMYWEVDEMFGRARFSAFGDDQLSHTDDVAWPVTLIERAS